MQGEYLTDINKIIGRNIRPYIIAEACINHQGDINIALEMIDEASKCGVSAVKFQLHDLDDEMLKITPQSKNFQKPLYQTLEETSLTVEEHKKLKERCNSRNVDYLCTPFSKKSADMLVKEIGIKLLKTGSGEFSNPSYLKYLSTFSIPMLISTGMSDMNTVIEFKKEFDKLSNNYALLHCVSAYPCPDHIVNLGVLTEYQKMHGSLIGLSDHTSDIWTSIGAVALGAVVIEKHFTLNKNWIGPDHKSSLDIKQLGYLVDGCNSVWRARGNAKEIFEEEQEIALWAHATVVSTKKINPGDILTINNIATKRPGPTSSKYIPADEFENVLGKVGCEIIEPGIQIKWDQITK